MSEKELNEDPLKDNVDVKAAKPNAASKIKRKRSKDIKFLSIENFHNLKPSEVYKHIQKLHRHIQKLKRKLAKYERKIIKVVRLLKFVIMINYYINVYFYRNQKKRCEMRIRNRWM